MQQLLRIDASARHEDSYSRALGDALVQAAQTRYPSLRVNSRDLQQTPIEPIQQATITGFYTPSDQHTAAHRAATALSDHLIGELQRADALLITTPMYNFSVPSSLKAWVDQVVRIGHTFSFEDGEFAGLVRADTAFVCCAYGAPGYGAGGALRAGNFLEPYLAFLLEFLGIGEISFFSAEALTADPQTVADAMAGTRRSIAEHFGVGDLER
ncbi:MAG: NAD(P)H-dependent oxidoreductase [Pseudomonadota bacterium]